MAIVAISGAATFSPVPADAAPAMSRDVAMAKSLNGKGTTVAAKDVEETGSVQTDASEAPNCERSRKRLFVDGEGWIVRRVTTCY